MPLSDVQKQLLGAMESMRVSQRPDGFLKCDVVLREALKNAGKYSEAAEKVFYGDYEADPVAFDFYCQLRALILSEFPEPAWAEGQGDLRLPAAPRYTECRITPSGTEQLRADT